MTRRRTMRSATFLTVTTKILILVGLSVGLSLRATSAAAATPDEPAPAAGREVTAPDAETIGWIFYDRAGLTPPLDDWARKDVERASREYKSPINEFNRDEYVENAKARLAKQFAAAKRVSEIRLELSGQLSDYDTEYEEFYIDVFKPGSFLSFKSRDETFTLKLTNAMAAYTWKVPKEQAMKIVQRVGSGWRSVKVSAQFRIVDASPTNGGGTLNMEAVGYTVLSSSGVPLGTVEIAKK